MKTKTVVLISGIGGDIGQSVARALGSGYDVIGCDMADSPAASIFAKRFHRVPPARDQAAYFRAVRDIIQKEKASFFVPVPEPEILALNKLRAELPSLDAKVLINNSRVVEVFSDKLKTAEFLQAGGWRAPRTCLLKDALPHDWPMPFIVKHRCSYGSKDVRIIRDEADLAHAHAKDSGDSIAQEYLPDGDGEYTTGVFSDGQKTAALTFRRKLGFGGVSREVELAHIPALETLAEGLANAVSLRGSINIQSRKVDGSHVPFEVNPRLSSTVYLRHFFGFPDLTWWIAHLEGRQFDYAPRFKSGRACRYLTETFSSMEPI